MSSLTPTPQRRDYVLATLLEAEAGRDPIALFRRWFDDAVAARVIEPNAMTLATVGIDGRPSARIVLLKGYDDRGFCFFTNYQSRKGNELAMNPAAALVFFWAELERQVRVEGTAEPTAAEESDAYYASRPIEARLGAWASPQSAVVADRDSLQRSYDDLARRFPDGDPPRPPYWGGYRVVPSAVEFWQGRPGRLHDRLRFDRDDRAARWTVERLAP